MKRLTRVWAIFDGVVNFLAILGGVLLGFITIIVTTEVFMRYVLGKTTLWVNEVTEYSMLFIAFLATTWLLKKEGHVSIDVLVNHLSPKPKAILAVIVSIIGALVCLVVTWYGIDITLDFLRLAVREQSVFQPPSFALYIVIPIGCFLLSIQFLRRAYNNLCNWRIAQDRK